MKLSYTIRAVLLALLSCVPVLAQTNVGGEQNVTYSGSVAVLAINQPANSLLTNSGVNTFILAVAPPTNSFRIYVANDTANSCANFSVQAFSTGNQTITSFNSNLNAWQSLGTATAGNPSLSASQPFTLPASQTIAVTSAPIVGTKIAVQIQVTASCPTTSIDMQIVFGTFSPTTNQVQGIVTPGGNGTTIDPVIVGGVDQSGLSRTVRIIHSGTDNFGDGWALGNALACCGTFANEDVPNGTAGPMAIMLHGQHSQGINQAVPVPVTSQNASGNNTTCASIQQGCAGLLVADSGFVESKTISQPAGTQLINFGSVDQGSGSVVGNCRVDVQLTALSGTTPTADFYFQDSPDNTNFTDRIHFLQMTAAPARAWGSVGTGGMNAGGVADTSHAFQNHLIAVNTIVQGQLSKYFAFSWVVTGGGAFTVVVDLTCK